MEYTPNLMQTYSGKYIDPLNLTVNDIDLYDLAHALSLQCRCNGHSKFFYSVATHSIGVWMICKVKGGTIRQQLAAICHDLSEALLSDIVSPIKYRLPEYIEAEKKVQDIIYEAVGLGKVPEQEYALVKECDLEMLYNEAKVLMQDVTWIPNYETYEFKYLDLVTKESYNHEKMRDTMLDIIDSLMEELKAEINSKEGE